MAGEWQRLKVADLQREGVLLVEDGNHGEYRPRPDEFVSQGVAFIRAADMDNGRVFFDSASKINERARQRITKGIGAPGDVLLSHKGTVGKIALVPMDAPPFVCSPQTTFWRALNPKVLDRKFLYVYLRSQDFREQLATRAGETDMAPYVSLTSQRGLYVLLPPIDQQRAIAHILGTLDDKIELNHRMNETLEAIARAMFKSWFVDFDPVRAKMNGEPPASICQRLGLTPDLLALFPDLLVDSELGEIPEGWCIRSVGDLIERLPVGKKYEQKTAKPSGEVPVLDQGKSGIIGYHNDEPGVMASSDNPVVVFANHTCYMRLINFPFSAIQNVLPFVGKGGDTIWVYYATLGKQSFIEYKGHWPDFIIHKIAVPDSKLANVFSNTAHTLIKMIWNSGQEAATLENLRDVLLPKLISGELSVPVTGAP
ncbi:restriction endonuclease subunit S [Sideroxydans sp. CL21]|uniref:restriction endonuclease subunit S n=1 Tax=Sideroxydans sp. CL21 TaxID=2600596 RepID=UPI0024BBF519|nr:restriction endonuclease subunit S [Sideroxydans sp. CL21]